jgi:hypothetical protein
MPWAGKSCLQDPYGNLRGLGDPLKRKEERMKKPGHRDHCDYRYVIIVHVLQT